MSERNGTTFTWIVHNFSYCWCKCDDAIESPVFCIYTPEETKWKLLLYPRGVAGIDDSISIYLYRNEDCKGAEKIKVEHCLEILDAGGHATNTSTMDEFEKDMRRGYPRYTTRGYLQEYLQQDMMTIRCNMLRFDDKAVGKREILARTIISIEKHIFQCPIDNFSNLEHNQKRSFMFKTETKQEIMQINLTIDNTGDIRFGFLSYDARMKFSTVKVSIIDSKKQDVDCGDYEYWFNYGKCVMLAINYTKKELIKKRRLYLSEDILVLRFELTISTGFASESIESDAKGDVSYPFPKTVSEAWRKCINHKNLSDCPCTLITDLTTLQKKQGACDMKLKSKTKTFPVHTLVLRARSPVFEAMFSTDMKEKTVGYVDVSDLDDETVRRFLVYLYSDQLDDLDWEDVVELCKAADKYAVISLREKCYMFLKDNLNLENACEILILSHLYCNSELKELAQSFILKNGKVILKSEAWKQLSKTNPKLALETTLRNWN